MSQLQIYSKVSVSVNGQKLAEYADVKLTRTSGVLPVNTVAKGFAGATQGVRFCEIEVGNAVPSAGVEGVVASLGSKQLSTTPVTLTLYLDSPTTSGGGKSFTSDGFILGDDIAFAVNSEAKLNFRFHGTFDQDWQ